MRQLQDNFQIALDYMHLQKTDNSIEYAKICERNLYLQVKIEDDEDYSSWLRKLENLDHLKRTRIFFQSLKKGIESIKISVQSKIRMANYLLHSRSALNIGQSIVLSCMIDQTLKCLYLTTQ